MCLLYLLFVYVRNMLYTYVAKSAATQLYNNHGAQIGCTNMMQQMLQQYVANIHQYDATCVPNYATKI